MQKKEQQIIKLKLHKWERPKQRVIFQYWNRWEKIESNVETDIILQKKRTASLWNWGKSSMYSKEVEFLNKICNEIDKKRMLILCLLILIILMKYKVTSVAGKRG